ncbi:hemolysin III family protein [Staphylococcus aureus]
MHSYIAHGTLASVSMSIYVISIFMMFISSTIYHSMQNETPHKYILRIIDHSMIYVAISGYIYAYFVNSCRWLDRLDSIYFIMGNNTLGYFI